MYWPEEESVSVLPGKSITSEDRDKTCLVKIGKSVYPGKTAGAGKLIKLSSLVCTHM